MSLTPQDIQQQKFKTKFRGYDVNEVDGFLAEVADRMGGVAIVLRFACGCMRHFDLSICRLQSDRAEET